MAGANGKEIGKGSTTMEEMAALSAGEPERREGERSERSLRGGFPAGADPEVPAKATRRRFSAEYKLKVVKEADRCTGKGELGALLRREGLYSSHLVVWRRQRDEGALKDLSRKRGRKATKPKVDREKEQLRRENERLKKELWQAREIISVQKKLSEFLTRMRDERNDEDA